MLKWIGTKKQLKEWGFEEPKVEGYPYYVLSKRGASVKPLLKVHKRTMAITSYQSGGLSSAAMEIIYDLTKAGLIGLRTL